MVAPMEPMIGDREKVAGESLYPLVVSDLCDPSVRTAQRRAVAACWQRNAAGECRLGGARLGPTDSQCTRGPLGRSSAHPTGVYPTQPPEAGKIWPRGGGVWAAAALTVGPTVWGGPG